MKEYNIGIEATMEIIKGKWKPLLLCYIGVGVNRNNQLLREIPTISQKVLTEQLNQLIQDGILKKRVLEKKPLHIEYEFTKYGESLKDILLILCQWGEQHIEKKYQQTTRINF